MPDDAPYAPPTRPVTPITPVAGVSYSPPSMPPQPGGLVTKPGGHVAPPRSSGEAQVVRPSGNYNQVANRPMGSDDSVAPTVQRKSSQRPLSQTPQASNASMSFSKPAGHRPLGLIAIVLVLDLGLAGSGAFLLAKGMAKARPVKVDKKTDKTQAPTAPSSSASAAAAPTTAPTTVAPSAVAVAAAPAARADSAAARVKPRGQAEPAGPITSPSEGVPVTAVPTTAVPPPTSTSAEVQSLGTRSSAGFEHCRGDQPVVGTIEIAFLVQPDGSIAKADTATNTTGNAELATCLARVIGSWRVSPFQGNTMSFVRPFSYP